MTSTYDGLTEKRLEFKAFETDAVGPLIGLDENELSELGFVGIAKRIGDLEIRERYCELAVAMLDANIAHYRSFATATSVPPLDSTLVVVSTLVVAVAAEYHSGTVAALLASAVWDYLPAETVRRRLKERRDEAEAHNGAVAD